MLNFIIFLGLLATYNCQLLASLREDAEPEVSMNTEQVIRHYGYPVEKHEVTTGDGYILTMFRIPHGVTPSANKTRPVVIMQHGLLDSSFTWVNNGPQKSMGFIFADQGFDVWLANSRGNRYSKSHTTLSSMSVKFWDFTWNEMAQYDLPAMIDHALKVTKATKVGYVGHSQGTQIGFAQFSEDPDMDKKVSAFVALTPVAYLGNVRTAIRSLASFGGILKLASTILTGGEFLPSNTLIQAMTSFLCGGEEMSLLCKNIGFLISGPNPGNLNLTRLPIYMAHFPAGTSAKNANHYAQSYLSNEFKRYDYGYFGNMRKYGQETPPKYNMKKIRVPTAMFWGGNDWLAVPKDVERGIEELGDIVKLKKFYPEYNHLDFVWGNDAYLKVFPEVAAFLLKYAN